MYLLLKFKLVPTDYKVVSGQSIQGRVYIFHYRQNIYAVSRIDWDVAK